MIYCEHCDKYFDHKEQDHAVYYPYPMCGDCVDDRAALNQQQELEAQASGS